MSLLKLVWLRAIVKISPFFMLKSQLFKLQKYIAPKKSEKSNFKLRISANYQK
jgi:hypothetical protein